MRVNSFQQSELNLGTSYEVANPKIIGLITNDLKHGRPFHYLFTGMVGSGKTYLGQKVVQSTKESIHWSLVSAMQHYKDHLRIIGSDYMDKMDADRKNDGKLNQQCLMLDDLGDEKPSTLAAHETHYD